MEQHNEDRAEFFSQSGDYRSFELAVQDRSIFVNAHFLAQISPFFACLCFNQFKEKKEGKATMGDEKFEDILTLICTIHPSSDVPLKPVDVDNFVMLVRLADKYQVKCLLKSCAMFIECEQFDYIKVDDAQLLTMLRSVVEFGLGKEAMIKLLKRATLIPLQKLIEHNAHNWLPSNASAVLFLAAKANGSDASSTVKGKHQMISIPASGQYCSTYGCSSFNAKFRCQYCSSLFCKHCQRDNADNSCISAPLAVSIQKCPIGEINVTMLE